jgi:hypothetical protein
MMLSLKPSRAAILLMLRLFLSFNMLDAISNRSVLVAWPMRSRIPNSSHSRYFESRCTIGAVVTAAKCGQLNMHFLKATVGALLL